MKNKLLATLFGAALVLGACGGGDDNASDAPADTNDSGAETSGVDAEKVVQTSCVSCHGSNLEGQGNAPSIAKAGATHSEEEIHDIVTNGKGAMPPMLKGDEADAVAAWLAEKK
ncbi:MULTISPECIES: cytochrome c551 [Sporosarcina]|uniref:cytochrome c551 n=1 Tax=Sporosarcina TaxID=1569 RepID=UPI00129B5C17|nr:MULTISPECIES: cytochrome c [Sporosarcina]GKV65836.1 cytochrome c-551 [Sporosarcina sp. NCCP-2331]GLB55960.1 cytochrome c-551 [Sporosarcina sp. NCCP-2378]